MASITKGAAYMKPKMTLDDELARLSVPEKRIRTVPDERTEVQKRAILIQQRINILERARKHLKSNEKWPTSISVRLHREAQARGDVDETSPLAETLISQMTARKGIRPTPERLAELLAPSASPRSEFPFPILSSKFKASFPCFALLPAEIRIEIWKLACQGPRFIEVQFCSEFYGPAFVKCIGHRILHSVCRESRDIVLNKINVNQNASSLKIQFCQLPNKELPFIPASDTIFFRDLYPGNLMSLRYHLYTSVGMRHLALPLSAVIGIPPREIEGFKYLLAYLNLETLTLVVGEKEKSWVRDRYVELRNVEEWLADGRERIVCCEGFWLDTVEVGRYLSGQLFDEGMRARPSSWLGALPPMNYAAWKGVNVRVVAWKRKE